MATPPAFADFRRKRIALGNGIAVVAAALGVVQSCFQHHFLVGHRPGCLRPTVFFRFADELALKSFLKQCLSRLSFKNTSDVAQGFSWAGASRWRQAKVAGVFLVCWIALVMRPFGEEARRCLCSTVFAPIRGSGRGFMDMMVRK
jgi:hypothetical protein